MAEFKDAPQFLIDRLEKSISKEDRKLALSVCKAWGLPIKNGKVSLPRKRHHAK